jgi:hypothetical protein
MDQAAIIENAKTSRCSFEVGPPTIVDRQSQGVNGAWVTCRNPVCLRSTPLIFGYRPCARNAFPNIARVKRFVCAACGSRRIDVAPDWRGHRAAGAGR